MTQTLARTAPRTAEASQDERMDRVLALPYGELAVALAASLMPTGYNPDTGADTPEQARDRLAAWADAGLAQMGQAQLWWIARRSTYSTWATPEFLAFWRSCKRADAAHDNASRLYRLAGVAMASASTARRVAFLAAHTTLDVGGQRRFSGPLPEGFSRTEEPAVCDFFDDAAVPL